MFRIISKKLDDNSEHLLFSFAYVCIWDVEGDAQMLVIRGTALSKNVFYVFF